MVKTPFRLRSNKKKKSDTKSIAQYYETHIYIKRKNTHTKPKSVNRSIDKKEKNEDRWLGEIDIQEKGTDDINRYLIL